MRNWNRFAILLAIAPLVASAQAAVVLSLVPSAATVNVGDTVTVSVQLAQDGVDLGNGTDALTTGFGMTLFRFELDTTGTAFAPSANAQSGSSVPSTWGDIFSPSTTLFGKIDTGFTASPIEEPASGQPVTLAVYTLTASSQGSNTVTLEDLGGSDDFGFEGADRLDDEIFGSITPLTITAIPEPGAASYFTSLAVVLAGVRYLRHRSRLVIY